MPGAAASYASIPLRDDAHDLRLRAETEATRELGLDQLVECAFDLPP